MAVVMLLILGACLASACTPEPVVQEEFPEPAAWFAVEDVEFSNLGTVTVRGQMLAEAAGKEPGSDVGTATGQSNPGEFPTHIAYGFWPDPDEVGMGEAVDVGPDGSFVFEYDLSRPDGIHRGWHVLQFDKEGWGSQMIWINVATQEWMDSPPG